MRVKDIMAYKVEIAHPDDSIADATSKMKTCDRDVLPVYEGHRLLGMVTEHDLMDLAQRIGLSAGTHPVREAMRPRTACCYENDDVAEALRAAEEDPKITDLQNLLVVDGEERPVGIVSLETLRTHIQEQEGAGVFAVDDVGSISSRASYDEDKVEFMSDESFPASDPPPAGAIAPSEPEGPKST